MVGLLPRLKLCMGRMRLNPPSAEPSSEDVDEKVFHIEVS
jgi:hypothetical protein